MLNFLPAILLIQLATAILVYMGMQWPYNQQLLILIVTFAVILALLSSFWFASIVRNMHSEDRAKLHKQHAREREKLILKAEREKAKATTKGYQSVEKATKNVHAKANFKVGAAVAVAFGAGALMIMSQLVTVGMMVLIASGSGLAGYLARMKHERQDKALKFLPSGDNSFRDKLPQPSANKKLK